VAPDLLPFAHVNVATLATVANVLSMARRLTRAQAGTVYSCEAEGLRFLVTQNDELAGSLDAGRVIPFSREAQSTVEELA
jgi:hypothetical protein